MNTKKTKWITLFLLLLAAGSFLTEKPCLAASADVQMSADFAEVTVGDNIFVYINIDSDVMFGNFEANLTYDDSILDYMGASSVIKGNSGFLKISDMNVLDGDNSRKYTMKFEALQVGICDITFSGPVKVYDFDTGYEMSVSSSELTLKVKAPETASTNAKLKTLKISPALLSPAFDTSIYEYNVNVGYETEQLIITALPEDKKSTVSITGNDLLTEGENKVVVSVLAESGTVIEYTIKVFREYAPTEATISPGATQSTFEITTIGGEKYAVYSGKYKLVIPDSSVIIPEGYQSASLIIEGVKISAFVPNDNKASDFVLIYAMNESGEAGFYQYDKVQKTLQRYVPGNLVSNENTASAQTDETALTKGYNANLRKAALVIALLSILCTLMIFISIRLLLKLKGRK